MKNKLSEKRIPTLMAFMIILVGIYITSLMLKSGITILSKASIETTPENLKISNITDSSFTVSFTTFEKTEAAVGFGETEELGNIVYDDRDRQSGGKNQYYTHYITISTLKPDTKYYFSVISGGNTYLDNEKNFTVVTGEKLESSPPKQNPLYGKIVLEDGSGADGALIYMTTSDSQLISALSKPSGDYIIPLNSVRNTDLNNYLIFQEDKIINLEIIRQNAKSFVKTLYKEENHIPTITIAKNYDFTNMPGSSDYSVSTASSGLHAVEFTPSKKEVKISTPKENDALVDQKPVFKGTAMPGKKVKITINSDSEIKAEITTDAGGNWSYRPNTILTPGKHTVTIETTDSYGILKKITQAFTVYAAGSQVDESATPSATPTLKLTPTPSVTASITPTATIALTPSLTISPIPTITPIIITPTLEIPLTQMPRKEFTTPIPTIEQAGNSLTSIALTSASAIFVLTGIFLLFTL